MQIRRVKVLPIVLLVVLLLMQYRLWIQPGGIVDLLRLRKQLVVEQHENDNLKKRNQVLLNQVQHLQNNNEAVESRARDELGMIKKGETFYQVVN